MYSNITMCLLLSSYYSYSVTTVKMLTMFNVFTEL